MIWRKKPEKVKQFIQDLLDKQKSEIIENIKKNMPEEGIKWMQEGYNKSRKGYTKGFNDCLQQVLNKLDK